MKEHQERADPNEMIDLETFDIKSIMKTEQ